MVFLGGAVLANLVCLFLPSLPSKLVRITNTSPLPQIADKEDMWVTKQEWEEQGARALEKLGPR